MFKKKVSLDLDQRFLFLSYHSAANLLVVTLKFANHLEKLEFIVVNQHFAKVSKFDKLRHF